ncbi:MAG TPA: hypothetical protein VN366_03990 [Feifaniaceae bacterium]|nr:hypothetical protein [Feifaniaceae bacterium]
MKKIISALSVLILLLLLAPTALAATVQVATEPAQITSAGTISARFSVVNDSAYEMRDINIFGNGLSGSSQLSSQVVPPNGKLNFTISTIEVTEDMLGQTIAYTLTWTENGAAKSKDVSITLGAAPAAEMTATRTASKTSGKSGDKVTLTYVLNNPGTAEMTGVTVKDAAAGNSPVASNLTLAPGTSKTVTYELTLGGQDAVSQPSITYQLNGEGRTLNIDPLTVTVANVQMDLAVTMSDPAPEGVAFTLVLKNNGNQAIGSITVKDELNNAVNAAPITLEAGKEQTLTYNVAAAELRNVSFVVTGTDASGQPYENRTTSYEVRPYVDPSHVSLSLSATVLQPLTDSGRMKVRFTVQNNSNVDMVNALISEAELGNIEPMDVLPLGETTVDKELLVNAPRELAFTLTASDPSGLQHTYEAKLMADYVALASPTPAASPAQEEEPANAGGMSGTLVTVLIVLAALMAVAGVALLALSIYERKRNATLEEEEPDELPRARNAAQARVSAAEREAQSQPYPPEQNRASRFAQPQREPVEFSAQTRSIPAERPEKPVFQPVSRTPVQPQERASGYTQERAPVQPQERASFQPRVPQEHVPAQPRVPQPQVRRVEPEPEQRPPQASPEIRNRVHRVRNTDEK